MRIALFAALLLAMISGCETGYSPSSKSDTPSSTKPTTKNK
jgi:hypothetical protein